VTLSVLLNEVADWSFVRLQGLYEVPFKRVLEQSGCTLVKNQGDAVGATAYLLKPQVAAQLLQHSVDIYEPVDHFLEHYQKHGIEFLAIRPYPVDITRAKSTIADRSERMPIKGLQKYIRSIARALDRAFGKQPWFPK
jgi:glycosyl transferase family 25